MAAEALHHEPDAVARPSPFESPSALFRSRLVEDAARPAAKRKLGGRWVDLTWAELNASGEELAWGLVALGIEPRGMVALIGATRVEWTECDLGVMFAGAISVPVYHTMTGEETRYILDDAGVVVAMVENATQLVKLQALRQRLPKLHHVVLMEGEGAAGDPWVLSLAQLRQRGLEQKARSPEALAARLAGQRREDLHTVLYTSGTTGQPKGVMLSNDNMLFAAEAIVRSGIITREMKHLMFLPFAHSFAQVVKCGWIGSGATQIYAESIEKLLDNAGETAPTALSAVPRVYEKVFGAVVSGGLAQHGPAGALFRLSLREFERYVAARERGEQHSSFGWSLAKKIVFPKLRAKLLARLGGKMEQLVSGGAALPYKIACFLDLLGFHILEGYGLTETVALTSVNLRGENRLGTVGRPYAGVEVKLSADGELLQRGRHVMVGYLNHPDATAEVIDKDGWFATGDVAQLDQDGYIKITDRKKDLIKTSQGKYVAPQAIEGALKTLSPLISQVVVIGEGHKFITVLVTVVEAEALKIAAQAGEPATTYAEATRSKAVHAQVREAVLKLNSGLASYESVKRFVVLDHDLTQEGGQLTPTLKVKRRVCTARYRAEIAELYREE
jgi:long-chain acyl-CoA synthetase